MDWSTLKPEERRRKLAELAQLSLEQTAPKFRIKRFYLDVAADRSQDQRRKDFTFGSVIKSFWVADWSGNFTAKIVPNHTVDRDSNSGLPLRKNMCMPFPLPVADACIEYAAQAGAWIDIAYSDSEDIDISNVVAEVSSTSYPSTGSAHSSVVATCTGTIQEVFPANGNRVIGTLQYKRGSGVVYLGTPAELAASDFLDACKQLNPGDDLEYLNSAALSWKSVGGDVVFSKTQETK